MNCSSLILGFFRQEYWRGLPFPSPGDLPNPWIEPESPALQGILYQLSHQLSPYKTHIFLKKHISLSKPLTLWPSLHTRPCLVGYSRHTRCCGWVICCRSRKLGCWATMSHVFSKPTGQQISWNLNMKAVYVALFSCIIDALLSGVFRAVTIHSCTCDRTAGWFHYAQLGENAYFNLPCGEVTLCSAALANQPFNHLGGWRLPLQPVIRLPAASLFSFYCQHFPGSRV